MSELSVRSRTISRDAYSFSIPAIKGAIGLSGTYNFLPLKEAIYQKSFPKPVRAASQPIAFADGSEAPMLLIAGQGGKIVDPRNTTSLAAAITAHHGVASLKLYPRVRHVGIVAALATATPWRKPDVCATVIDFIRGRLAR